MRSRRNLAVGALVAVAGVWTLAAWAAPALGQRSGEGDRPEPVRYECARVVIDEGLAVLVTDDAIQKIEIPPQPPPDSTVFRNAAGPMQKRFDALLYSLNALGAQGWELMTSKVPAEGDEVLVRRVR